MSYFCFDEAQTGWSEGQRGGVGRRCLGRGWDSEDPKTEKSQESVLVVKNKWAITVILLHTTQVTNSSHLLQVSDTYNVFKNQNTDSIRKATKAIIIVIIIIILIEKHTPIYLF